MHGADVNEGFLLFHIDKYRRNIVKAQRPGAKTAMSVGRITFNNIKSDCFLLFSSMKIPSYKSG